MAGDTSPILREIKKFFAQSRGETGFFIKPDDAALISFELFATSTPFELSQLESRETECSHCCWTATEEERRRRRRRSQTPGAIQARN